MRSSRRGASAKIPRAARSNRNGAAEAHAEDTGLHRDPADEAFLAPLVAKVRAALPEASYTAAEADGRALGYEKALAEARASLRVTG